MNIKDPLGKWYVLNAVYPFHDHESNTRFDPGVLTKATPTKTLAANSCISEVADPTVPAPVAAPIEVENHSPKEFKKK